MRRALPPVLILLASAVLSAAPARAQTTVHNTVTVTIPTVLRLRIDRSTAQDRASVDFTLEGTTLTPASLQIDVFANAGWALTVSYASDRGPGILYRVAGTSGWWSPDQKPTIAQGPPTRGWRALHLDFSAQAPTAEPEHRTLVFTLARP